VRAGVPFMSVNSASNIWIGHEFDCIRYSKTISEAYPHMTGCAPYWDALFAVVTIDDEGIHVKGRKSSFVGPTPYELGFPICRIGTRTLIPRKPFLAFMEGGT
jgi:hypothetical protein